MELTWNAIMHSCVLRLAFIVTRNGAVWAIKSFDAGVAKHLLVLY